MIPINDIEANQSNSVQISVMNNNSSVTISNFPNSSDIKYSTLKIYRTKASNINGNYYYIDTIDPLFYQSYQDTISDVSLNITMPKQFFYTTKQLNRDMINNPNLDFTVTDKNIFGNLILGEYQYIIQYYNSSTNNKTLYSAYKNIVLPQNSQTIIEINVLSYATNYSNVKIYRTKNNTTTFYLLTDINFNQINNSGKIIFNDNITDSNLTIPLSYQNIGIQYKILRVSIFGMVPNLNPYISHSTDYRYLNIKQSSDMNDYIFNQPLIMMMNTSNTNTFANTLTDVYSEYYNYLNKCTIKNTFTSGYIVFYNINFKINETSLIKLNDIDVEYLLPISNQQFLLIVVHHHQVLQLQLSIQYMMHQIIL
jgi:hypothetical protein